MRITRDLIAKTIDLDQDNYKSRVLAQFAFSDARSITNPMEVGLKFTEDVNVKHDQPINEPYREAVGALIYLATWTRLDIFFAIEIVGQYVSEFQDQMSEGRDASVYEQKNN